MGWNFEDAKKEMIPQIHSIRNKVSTDLSKSKKYSKQLDLSYYFNRRRLDEE